MALRGNGLEEPNISHIKLSIVKQCSFHKRVGKTCIGKENNRTSLMSNKVACLCWQLVPDLLLQDTPNHLPRTLPCSYQSSQKKINKQVTHHTSNMEQTRQTVQNKYSTGPTKTHI